MHRLGQNLRTVGIVPNGLPIAFVLEEKLQRSLLASAPWAYNFALENLSRL
jgi:hypothetical protein